MDAFLFLTIGEHNQDEEFRKELLRGKEFAMQRQQAAVSKERDKVYLEAELNRAQEQEQVDLECRARAVQATRAAVLEQFELQEEGGMAETGITVKVERRGAVITALKPGTSAAAGELKQGDLISQIGDDIVTGFSAFEIMARMRGEKGSLVEIAASRVLDEGKVRISDLIERDVSLPPMQAEIGVSLKTTSSGARVAKVFEATTADEEGMQPGDIISMINGGFVAGMGLKEISKLLRGLAGSSVDIAIMRKKDNVKSRLEFLLTRDFNLTPMPVQSIFDRATVGLFLCSPAMRVNFCGKLTDDSAFV